MQQSPKVNLSLIVIIGARLISVSRAPSKDNPIIIIYCSVGVIRNYFAPGLKKSVFFVSTDGAQILMLSIFPVSSKEPKPM